jgi:spoIIIJ-associated protein
MMDSVEAEGLSIDEAIENALVRLGTTRNRVEISILTNAARGLFGIGARKARVRATVRPPIDAEGISSVAAAREPVASELVAPAPVAPAPVAPEPVAPEPVAPEPVISTPAVSNEEAAAPAAHPVVSSAVDTQGADTRGADTRGVQRAQSVLQEIIKHISVTASVTTRQDEEHTILEITGDTTGVLIGRRGQMLDALEYIVNRIVARDETGAHFVVDSQDYRERHRKSLEDLARRMGEQAKKKRKAVTLNPLSPRDRRSVHMVLHDDPALTTKSAGDGYYRKLIIIPTGAGKAAGRKEPKADT